MVMVSGVSTPDRLRPGLALIGLVLIDQLSKLYAVEWLSQRPPVPVIPGLLDMLLVYNRGASFGFLHAISWGPQFLMAVAVVAIVMFAHLFWTAIGRRQQLVAAVLLAGTLGNLLDRIQQNLVVDFLHLHIGSVSLFVFNLADSFLTLGVIGWCWLMFRERVPNP